MRLKELHLLKYGSFDGQVLRFQSTRPGLHVVFGHNEAGKSTALRALKALLFGIALRLATISSWQRRAERGALLQTTDGREFEVQRSRSPQFARQTRQTARCIRRRAVSREMMKAHSSASLALIMVSFAMAARCCWRRKDLEPAFSPRAWRWMSAVLMTALRPMSCSPRAWQGD